VSGRFPHARADICAGCLYDGGDDIDAALDRAGAGELLLLSDDADGVPAGERPTTHPLSRG
jgi:hypothetical protein